MEKSSGVGKGKIIVDAHCDTILDMLKNKRSLGTFAKEGQADLPRLFRAGVRVQFFAIFIESWYKPHEAVRRAFLGIDVFYRELEAKSANMGLVSTR